MAEIDWMWIWQNGWGALEVAAILAVVLFVNMILVWFGLRMAAGLARELIAELNANLALTSLSEALGRADVSLQTLLLEKFKDVNHRALHHLAMVRNLAGYTFMQLVMCAATSGIAAVALFFLSRDGWATGKMPLMILFASMATIAAIYAALPSVFKLSENIRSNVAAYVQLLQVSDELRSYAYLAGVGHAEPAEAFLARIDKEAAAARTIAFAFDLAKAPAMSVLYSELANALGNRRSAAEQRQIPAAEASKSKQPAEDDAAPQGPRAIA